MKSILKKCVIFGSVETEITEKMKKKEADTLYIAADGGCEGMLRQGLIPDIIVGDFDSVSGNVNIPEGIEIIKYPIEKDDTDTSLAVKIGFSRGCTEFYLYGCLGGDRLDHSIATLQTLTYISENGGKATAFDTALKNGKTGVVISLKNGEVSFPSELEGTFSVIAANGECLGVTIENAKYNIENQTLSPSFPLGVSNSFVKGKSARISVENGTLWVFYSL